MFDRSQKPKTVLVTGGAGYIGSHMAKLLKDQGYLPIILDDLSSGFREKVEEFPFVEGKVGDKELIKKIHQQYQFSAVIDFAAFLQVEESVSHPLKYYQNNVVSSVNLLEVLQELGVKDFVFSSTAAIYGQPIGDAKIVETDIKSPINPYGQSKWMVENILADYCKADPKFNAVCLRYFNVAGADPEIKAVARKCLPSNLIPIVLLKAYKNETVSVFGGDCATPDGSCVRDYIHVKDICTAHLYALQLIEKTPDIGYLPLNLGTGKGHSVLEVLSAAEHVTGKSIKRNIVGPRPGDAEFVVADGSLAREKLNWNPQFSDLETMIKDAWEYELKMQEIQQQQDNPPLKLASGSPRLWSFATSSSKPQSLASQPNATYHP